MRKKGSVLVSILIILSSLMMFGIAISTAIISTSVKTRHSYQTKMAMALAEAGINKAIWELNQASSSYTGELNNTSLSDGASKGAFDVSVTNLSFGTSQITATGYVPSKENYQAKKTIRVKLTDTLSSNKAAFFYGVELGDLGARLDNNAYILGNVYSGGTLSGGNGAYVKGTVMMYNSGSNYGTINGVDLKDPANLNPPYQYNAWAHNIRNTRIYGNATYSCNDSSCFSGNTVKGSSHPSSPDPTPITASDWPISDTDINGWKQLAESGGNLAAQTCNNSTIGTTKVTGNMTVTNTCTLNGLVWVTGNLTINIGSTLKLDSSFGANSGTIIVDGQIHLDNGSIIQGSGNPKSSIMLLSTKVNNSLYDAAPAILADNGSAGAVYYAKNGILKINNTGHAVSFSGRGLYLAQNAYFSFDKGIKNPNFTNGPGGMWGITDWQIVY